MRAADGSGKVRVATDRHRARAEKVAPAGARRGKRPLHRAGGRGGYNIDLLARVWALQMDEIVGVGLPDALPADWLARAEQETGGRFAARLLEDSAQMIPADHREKADAEANRVVDQARSLVREERLFAIEHGAEVVSFDRDFQRFIGLRSRLLT